MTNIVLLTTENEALKISPSLIGLKQHPSCMVTGDNKLSIFKVKSRDNLFELILNPTFFTEDMFDVYEVNRIATDFIRNNGYISPLTVVYGDCLLSSEV